MSEAKDADVDRLTDWLESRDFYELCQAYRHARDGVGGLLGMQSAAEAFEALKRQIKAQSLSQEAVREEALERGVLATAEGTFVPAVILDGKRFPDEYGDWRALPRHPTWQMKEAGGEAYLQSKELEGQNTGLTAMHMAEGIYHAMWKTPEVGLPSVALKREPNAAAESYDPKALDGPAPAAPVAEMVRRIRHVAHNIRAGFKLELSSTEADICDEAAALLARLGQGWMTSRPAAPESETPEPETDALLKARPALWEDWNSADFHALEMHARSLERRLSLAQTEIKGHMRVEDELKEQLALAQRAINGALQVANESQARIAELRAALKREPFDPATQCSVGECECFEICAKADACTAKREPNAEGK